MSRNANHCVMWSFSSRYQVSSPWPPKTTGSNWDIGCVSQSQIWPASTVLWCRLAVCSWSLTLLLQFWLYSEGLAWGKPSSTNRTAEGVHKSVRRTFSYAPRKMKPPMLMNVTLGMLPANSLQRSRETIYNQKLEIKGFFRQLIIIKKCWLIVIKDRSLFAEKSQTHLFTFTSIHLAYTFTQTT